MPSVGSSRAPALPANSRAAALTWLVSRVAPLVAVKDTGDLLTECLPRAARDRAAQPGEPHPDQHAAAVGRHVRRRPFVIPVHPGGQRAAARAGNRHVPNSGPREDHLAR